jgi:predicted RNA-binding Zn ribbon-like protein
MTWLDQRVAPGRLELIRAFVNTRDIARGPEALRRPADARAWFVAHGLADRDLRLGATSLRSTLELREAFRSLLLANAGSPLPAAATATVNAAAARARLAPRLAEDGSSQLTLGARGLDAALGALTAVMFDAIAAGTWTRLRACATCQWAFYDASRNRSSRWCDMSICGNRAKQDALRHRRKASPLTSSP